MRHLSPQQEERGPRVGSTTDSAGVSPKIQSYVRCDGATFNLSSFLFSLVHSFCSTCVHEDIIRYGWDIATFSSRRATATKGPKARETRRRFAFRAANWEHKCSWSKKTAISYGATPFITFSPFSLRYAFALRATKGGHILHDMERSKHKLFSSSTQPSSP